MHALRIWPMIAALWVAGCFQPVDPSARVVAACHGDCPFGACDQGCAETADASCTTPEDCLHAYSCSKQGSAPCTAYKADNFQVGVAPTACSSVPGSYCATTIASYGTKGTFAVLCTDGGITSTECPSYDPCSDAGRPPPACDTACGKRYCVK